jgi:hypothetical protein
MLNMAAILSVAETALGRHGRTKDESGLLHLWSGHPHR